MKLKPKPDSEINLMRLMGAAEELLEYAHNNVPDGEYERWLGPHPVEEMEKLLKELQP